MIKVKVPATSANMGPGFDALGVAVNLYNEFSAEVKESGLAFEGFPEEFCNEDNIVYKSMLICFNKAGFKVPGLKISALKQEVPVSRGLGSSSTCIVGGLVLANEIMNMIFTKEEIFQMSVEIEGHPDNVAPAVLGGMVVSINEKGTYYYEHINIKNDYKFVAIVPNFRLSTSDAREVLPKSLTMKDGVYNVSRVGILVAALSSGNDKLLKYACKDAFHENYRSKLIEGFYEVKDKAYKFGALACYLSGAGPTIMAIIDSKNYDFAENIKKFLKENLLKWSVFELSIDKLGAAIIEGEK